MVYETSPISGMVFKFQQKLKNGTNCHEKQKNEEIPKSEKFLRTVKTRKTKHSKKKPTKKKKDLREKEGKRRNKTSFRPVLRLL